MPPRSTLPPHTEDTPTFKTRVEEFWKWWHDHSANILAAIDDGDLRHHQEAVSDAVNRLGDGFAWVFGPSPDGKPGHSFTISGEGDIHKQFLTRYWRNLAPDFSHWTFHDARQPGNIGPDHSLKINGNTFRFGELWITPSLNEEREIVDIAASHPLFNELNEGPANMALFLLLDEVLGEFGTDSWLGAIESTNNNLAGAIPALELRDYLHDLEIERGWRKFPPTESSAIYKLPEPSPSWPRGDTLVGSTRNMRLMEDFLDQQGPLPDSPLAGTGANFVYLAFDSHVLPEGKEVEVRAVIEDNLDRELDRSDAGEVIGGALGLHKAYIDMLIVDDSNSLNVIQRVLEKQHLLNGSALHFFSQGYESPEFRL